MLLKNIMKKSIILLIPLLSYNSDVIMAKLTT